LSEQEQSSPSEPRPSEVERLRERIERLEGAVQVILHNYHGMALVHRDMLCAALGEEIR